uniref:Uncharacterized protein n=1 Tax=Heterorhabditis bacteriophora TaxID=37862 RepID=A0A1I7XEQ4_HETBA
MVSFRQHTKIPERQRLKVSSDRVGAIDTTSPIHFCYQPGRLPRVRQMWYSLCDIKLPLAEALLKRDFSSAPDAATNGWINTVSFFFEGTILILCLRILGCPGRIARADQRRCQKNKPGFGR